jgi:hypothetical protein
MWRFLIIIALLLGVAPLWGQQRCGTPQPSDADYLIPAQQVDQRNNILTVPVVFHIVLEDDHPGISEAEIKSQLDALNRDFNLRNADIFQVPVLFRKYRASANIEFCLASKDPQGEKSMGITYTTTDIENIGQHIFQDGRQSVHYDVLGGKDAWDTDRYLNVWVAEMESFSGRSSFPAMGKKEEDGVVVDPAFFGNLGNADPMHTDGRTLVHEVGHYFNLRHPWLDNGCEFDDGVEDTPQQDKAYFGCPDPETSKSCGSLDMVQNFMQYGYDPCLLYFTKDQVDMMRNILQTTRKGLLMNDEACKSAEETSTLQLFYNPVKQNAQIIGGKPDISYTFNIIDLSGKILELNIANGYYSPGVDLSDYPVGVYIIQVEGEGQTISKKIFKYD